MQSGSEISVYKLHNTNSSKMHSKKVCCFPKMFAKYQMSNFWNNCNRQNSWAYLKWTRSVTMHFFIKAVVWPQVGQQCLLEGPSDDFWTLVWLFGRFLWRFFVGIIFFGTTMWVVTFGTNFWKKFGDLTLNELWTRVSSRSITMHFCRESCLPASSWAAMPSEGALGRYSQRLLDFVRTFWNIFLELTLNELWTRVSSRSITMHFLSWKLSSGLKSGSNAFWGALEGLAPPLSMTSPVLFALALTSLSLKGGLISETIFILVRSKVILLRGEATEIGRRTKFWWAERPTYVG